MSSKHDREVFDIQRTEEGLYSDALIKEFRAFSKSKDPADVALRSELSTELRDIAPGTVHQNTLLTNLSIAYKNDEYIGTQLMPIIPVDKRSNSFVTYAKRDRMAAPNDAIVHRATPNEISDTRGTDNYSVKDYALMDYVDQTTLDNQDGVYDELGEINVDLNERMALREEIRIATIMTTPGNYAGNTVTLSGQSQFDSASGGDPLGLIIDSIAGMWGGMGGTDLVGFTSPEVFNRMARHPALRDLFKYTAPGLARKDMLAGFLGLDKLLIGGARTDTANEGQAAVYSRIWGKHFGIVRVAKAPSKRVAAFGATFRLKGDPTTTQWVDYRPGKKGGIYEKVGISEDHKILAADTGFLILNAVA